MTAKLHHKTFSQDPKPEILHNYLEKNFPGGEYYSAYEASFCGFEIHRSLNALGIKNIVVNPADIPTTDKEKKQKEDMRDSRKIARSLRSGELQGIYVPTKTTEELRSLVRYRHTLVKDISRNKNRIKSFLYFKGIEIPEEMTIPSKYWSNKFTLWIKDITLPTTYGTIVLQDMLNTMLLLRSKLLEVTRELRKAAASIDYNKLYLLLTSIPGIGLITAMGLISELENIKRFKRLDHLCSYVGLVPTTNSSGEHEKTGRVTPRANRFMRSAIIESSWVAAKNDPALSLAFSELSKKMKPSEAIIRIAKKLLNRIRFVLKNETKYVPCVVS